MRQDSEHLFLFPTEIMLSYITFLPGLVFNYVFHKYIPQIWIATFLNGELKWVKWELNVIFT